MTKLTKPLNTITNNINCRNSKYIEKIDQFLKEENNYLISRSLLLSQATSLLKKAEGVVTLTVCNPNQSKVAKEEEDRAKGILPPEAERNYSEYRYKYRSNCCNSIPFVLI